MNEMCCASSRKPPRNFYSYLTLHLNNCRTNAPPNAKSNEIHLLFAFLALVRCRRSRQHCVGARRTASAFGKFYLRRDGAQTMPTTVETNDSLECGYARVLEYHFLGMFDRILYPRVTNLLSKRAFALSHSVCVHYSNGIQCFILRYFHPRVGRQLHAMAFPRICRKSKQTVMKKCEINLTRNFEIIVIGVSLSFNWFLIRCHSD